MSMSANILRDAVSMLSVVMLIGGVIVVVVGLWHAARRNTAAVLGRQRMERRHRPPRHRAGCGKDATVAVSSCHRAAKWGGFLRVQHPVDQATQRVKASVPA
jgi:hypothetical protein